jgi:hypothetical protein
MLSGNTVPLSKHLMSDLEVEGGAGAGGGGGDGASLAALFQPH